MDHEVLRMNTYQQSKDALASHVVAIAAVGPSIASAIVERCVEVTDTDVVQDQAVINLNELIHLIHTNKSNWLSHSLNSHFHTATLFIRTMIGFRAASGEQNPHLIGAVDLCRGLTHSQYPCSMGV
ncbi:P15 [Pseudomonas phage phi2954]|uniref:p15 n=1 Tax=Pseudomonas phage phi2954 TaxID=593131 RepID=C0KIT5_9VIRU|nr:P15 [Pseudomonas phage phi2954]ACM91120.1 P15 [Pseudomonas phage phi2954]